MKTVFITGGTVNTGRVIAYHFAREGYNVAISGRNGKNVEEVAAQIASETGADVRGYALEISDVNKVLEIFAKVENDFGSIDTFVANAANLGIDFGLMNTNEDDFLSITDVNIKGTFFCCKAAAEIMKRHGGGNIVTMGSVQGTGAVRGRTVYSMTKAAISALVKNMAYELGEYNIRANNIVAGAIHSERWDELPEDVANKRRSRYPIGREATQQEIANAVYYLGTDLSASVTGTDLTIDSGISVCILPYEKEN